MGDQNTADARYYGGSTEEAYPPVSRDRVKRAVLEAEELCRAGWISEAVQVLKRFVTETHGGRFDPISVKSGILRIMCVFSPPDMRHEGDPSCDDALYEIIEALLAADTWERCEQSADMFCSYILQGKEPAAAVPELVLRVLEYIQQNYQNKLRLEDAANAVHMNKSYLSLLFQRTMGVSYSQYLEDLRLREAKRMLRTTNLSVAEIAASVGFSNQNYFAKVFKNATHISPSRYRKTP